jgi:hypothetical protein
MRGHDVGERVRASFARQGLMRRLEAGVRGCATDGFAFARLPVLVIECPVWISAFSRSFT